MALEPRGPRNLAHTTWVMNIKKILYSLLSSLLAIKVARPLHKKMKDLFSKCDKIRSFLLIWSHLLKKSLTENFIFCAVDEPSFAHIYRQRRTWVMELIVVVKLVTRECMCIFQLFLKILRQVIPFQKSGLPER